MRVVVDISSDFGFRLIWIISLFGPPQNLVYPVGKTMRQLTESWLAQEFGV